MKFILICFFGLTFVFVTNAQGTKPSLELNKIMTGQDFIGHWPEGISWSANGKEILFNWNHENEVSSPVYSFDLQSKALTKQVSGSKKHLYFDPAQAKFINQIDVVDHRICVYHKQYSTKSEYLNLYEDLYNIQRLNSENEFVFEWNSNLYKYNYKVLGGSIIQLTRLTKGTKKEGARDTSFLGGQQLVLFNYLKEKSVKDSLIKALDAKSKSNDVPVITYGDGELYSLKIDPSCNFVVLKMHFGAETPATNVEHFVTEDGYTQSSKAREKVSDKEPNEKLAILNLDKDSLKWIDFSGLSDIRRKPLYIDSTGKGMYLNDRSLFIHDPVFSTTKRTALLDIRSADNKDRWIAILDCSNATIKEIDHQHDEAWIGGPGISSWNESGGTLEWMEDGVSFIFQSEKTGYSHLYLYESDSIIPLTEGQFEVSEVQVAKDKAHLYLTANKTHPGNRDFYSFEIKTKKWTSILTAEGFHEVLVSPDEKYLAIRYSDATHPWEVYWAKNMADTKMQRITTSTTKEFESYPWRNPEVLQFNASDGVGVYARIYTPEVSKANHAAVMFVHGAGYLQNAHHYWSNYYREYMFHNLLVDQGYTVLDVDYRASEGYGRDYRTAIYRFMGGRDLQDFIDAKRFLVNDKGIDSNRVGIYGGSYGGFITLMGLFTSPKTFACGAALRSVTDWAHYNHEYTSNILNNPETDPKAFIKSSPIYYAQNLEKPLLILHGMVDDNVQFQDVVRLNQRLIELGKKDWNMALYPVESHGFKENASWQDEYRRIYELFELNLLK